MTFFEVLTAIFAVLGAGSMVCLVGLVALLALESFTDDEMPAFDRLSPDEQPTEPIPVERVRAFARLTPEAEAIAKFREQLSHMPDGRPRA